MAGEKTALELAMEGREAAPLSIDEQLALLDLPDTPSVRDKLAKSNRGRPPGARNRRTVEMQKFLLAQYKSPLEVLAQIAATPTEVLASALGCKKVEALQERRLAALAALPYLHQKMPVAIDVTNTKVVHLTIVEGEPTGAGSGAGDDEVLTIDAELVELAKNESESE